MGRRKKCEQIKRTNNVMVRFTDAEYASISISAEQASGCRLCQEECAGRTHRSPLQHHCRTSRTSKTDC